MLARTLHHHETAPIRPSRQAPPGLVTHAAAPALHLDALKTRPENDMRSFTTMVFVFTRVRVISTTTSSRSVKQNIFLASW